MADGQANGVVNAPASAPQGGAPASGGGGSFSVPEGYELAPRGFREQAEQWKNTASGASKFWQTASKFGIKSEQDFEKWGPVLEQAGKRKLSPAMIRAMLSDEAEEDLGGGEARQGPQFDPEAFKQEMEQKFLRQRHEIEHEQLSKAEQALLDEGLNGYFGDEQADDYQKELHRRAMRDWLEENRPLYPENHPLAKDRLAPYGKDHVGKASDFFRSLRDKAKGASAAAKADATIKGGKQPPPLNGTKAGQGKPDNTNDRRPDGLPSKAGVEAAFAARKAARGG